MHSEGEIKIENKSYKEIKAHPASDNNREEWQENPKSEQLKRITNKLTEIFSANQRKVERYEEISHGIKYAA